LNVFVMTAFAARWPRVVDQVTNGNEDLVPTSRVPSGSKRTPSW
jgi:hypothetical protein